MWKCYTFQRTRALTQPMRFVQWMVFNIQVSKYRIAAICLVCLVVSHSGAFQAPLSPHPTNSMNTKFWILDTACAIIQHGCMSGAKRPCLHRSATMSRIPAPYAFIMDMPVFAKSFYGAQDPEAEKQYDWPVTTNRFAKSSAGGPHPGTLTPIRCYGLTLTVAVQPCCTSRIPYASVTEMPRLYPLLASPNELHQPSRPHFILGARSYIIDVVILQ